MPTDTDSPSRRVKLRGLSASDFQHPLDRQATENLKRIKGFDFLVTKFIEYGFERFAYVYLIGSSVRVSKKQMPGLYALLAESCKVLDMDVPELYVQQGGVTAYTSGHHHPHIVVGTGLLDLLDDNEVMSVLAHELGHVKCGHVLYKTMARFIVPFIERVGRTSLGLGSLIGSGIEAGLLAWDRRSELSADRASLLVLQNPTPCMSALMKLAGGSQRWADQLDVEQFVKQARAYYDGTEPGMADRFYQFVMGSATTHPFTVERAKALDKWADGKEYREILERKHSFATASS